MALFGTLASVRAQGALTPGLKAALAFAEDVLTPGTTAHRRVTALAAGETHREELGGGLYAMESAYLTKARPEGFFETHRRYLDVQVVVAGEELMEVIDAGQVGVQQPYDEAKDFTKHTDTAVASVLRLRAGEVAIFWPADVHMPSLAAGQPALVRKIVVKVPVGA